MYDRIYASQRRSLGGQVTTVRLSCAIDGCNATWSVESAKLMKKSMDEHRQQCHPDWLKPEPKPMTPYRRDYGGRTRQF